MKCPECGAWSTVLDTREGPHETVKRRRQCGNGHRFLTFEMTGPARNPGSMARAAGTMRDRLARWERDQAIRRMKDMNREHIAAHFGISVDHVRDIQSGRRRRKC